MSAYARPVSLDEALELLAADGAVPLGGGTDLAGQVDRGIRQPAALVDLQVGVRVHPAHRAAGEQPERRGPARHASQVAAERALDLAAGVAVGIGTPRRQRVDQRR